MNYGNSYSNFCWVKNLIYKLLSEDLHFPSGPALFRKIWGKCFFLGCVFLTVIQASSFFYQKTRKSKTTQKISRGEEKKQNVEVISSVLEPSSSCILTSVLQVLWVSDFIFMTVALLSQEPFLFLPWLKRQSFCWFHSTLSAVLFHVNKLLPWVVSSELCKTHHGKAANPTGKLNVKKQILALKRGTLKDQNTPPYFSSPVQIISRYQSKYLDSEQ